MRADGAGVGGAYDLTVQAGGRTVMRHEVKECEPPRRTLLEKPRPPRDDRGSRSTGGRLSLENDQRTPAAGLEPATSGLTVRCSTN